MNSPAYSAYPDEGEFLLMEGCRVYILAVESDVEIKNSSKGMSKYAGKTINIVHMYHGA